MHKKLLGLAVAGALAAPVAALAQVEVYGTIHMSINKMKYGEGTAPGTPSKSAWDVASHASNVGVRGRENVGGGQTAWFQVETNAAMERSNNVAHTSNFASRNSAVGMQGAWGNLFLGQWTTPWADLDALWSIGTVGHLWPGDLDHRPPGDDRFGAESELRQYWSAVSAACPGGSCDSVEAGGGVGHPFWRRISNSIHYQSPVMGGAQVKVAYQTNQDKADDRRRLLIRRCGPRRCSWSGHGRQAARRRGLRCAQGLHHRRPDRQRLARHRRLELRFRGHRCRLRADDLQDRRSVDLRRQAVGRRPCRSHRPGCDPRLVLAGGRHRRLYAGAVRSLRALLRQ